MFARSLALTLAAALAAGSATVAHEGASDVAPDRQAWLEVCEDWDEWDKPAPPYRIHANTYYVGTCGIAAILVVGGDGLILLDSGTEPGSKVVSDNIAALGYDIADVKAMLVSHEHFDHVGGMARLQQLSGATIYAGQGASPVIRSGKADPRDPQAGMHEPMQPVPGSVRSVKGGESGMIAGVVFTPTTTPGHTIGALSWHWSSCDAVSCISIVYADSLSPVSRDDYRYSDHPALVAEYRAGLARLAALDCDVLLTPHPSASEMVKRMSGGAPWTNPDGCKNYSGAIGLRLDRRLAEEERAVDDR
uniref:subclass B3 metallo-beta-lactamase n=1 Tax=Parerythrobacter lutipelagi TaxID=1964208 RepID=UPI00195A6BEE|nr:subclass B3 metallo-beta-lactamase [Parerythrobacter lutipelagi]